MAVRFILGRAGCGKTRHCIDAAAAELRRAAEGPPLILLVPEQATFQVERELLTRLGDADDRRRDADSGRRDADRPTDACVGQHRARVLSFRRFASLVFNEVGGPVHPPISALAKQMALRAVLEPLRGRLTSFAAALDRHGFLLRLAGLFREFHQYQVTSDALRRRSQREPRERLRRKLTDLADAFDAFNDYLREARFTDPDAALTLAADRLGRASLARNARVWIDGFAGFTPQELHFLCELLGVAGDVEIALVCDPATLPKFPGPPHVQAGRLFRRTEQTYLRLRRLLADKGVPVAAPLVLDRPHRFANAPALAAVERELFAPTTRAEPPPEPPASPSLLAVGDAEVLLVEAPDRRAEARAAANHVRRLVDRFGYRLRDVAVILRSGDDYWPLLAEAFDDAGLPCFQDRRQPICHHPLVELLRSAVASLTRRSNGHDVIAWLKTDLPAGRLEDVSLAEYRDAVDRLENYALAFGLTGGAWFDPDQWRYHERSALGDEDDGPADPPPGLARAGELTRRALAPLARLSRALAQADGPWPIETWTARLWRMLVEVQAESTLARWAEQERPARPAGGASVHVQAFAKVVELLGELTTALRGRPAGAAAFGEILEAGLSQLTLGLVPPSLDQVLIGQIERSRHPHIRAALVLGMAERSFPHVPAPQPILTDDERCALAGKSNTGEPLSAAASTPAADGEAEVAASASAAESDAVELAPSRTELLFDEDLMAYLALTRPAERLWLSYPAADDAGRPISPSRYIRALRQRRPDVPLVRLSRQHPTLLAVGASELAGQLVGRMALGGEQPPAALEVRLYELMRQGRPAELARVAGSLAYCNEPALSPRRARAVFAPGGALSGSVTRLETFAACPFQHLARYALRLRPRQRVELDGLQLGRFYHDLLRRLFQRLSDQQGPVRWSAASPEQLRQLVAELAADARERLAVPALSTGAAGYVFDEAERAVAELCQALREGSAVSPRVRQIAAELSFGPAPEAALRPLRVDLGDGATLLLGGTIDRIDLADDGALFVIDYKTGETRVDWSGVRHGLSLQLLGYLLALEQNRQPLAELIARLDGSADGLPLRAGGAFYQRIIGQTRTTDPPYGPNCPDDDDALSCYQRRGLFLADAADLLDASVPPQGKSLFLRLSRNKDGSLSAHSESVSRGQLAGLLELTADWLACHGRSILAGEAAVRPFRLGSSSPCGWCDFSRVCRFDFDYNRPNYLDTVRRNHLLEMVAGPGEQDA